MVVLASDMIERRFGRLLVESAAPRRPHTTHRRWSCICDCGGRREVRHDALLRGDTRSCGCLGRELSALRAPHGEHLTRLYKIWSSMRERCLCATHAGFGNYGGRGITITAEWDEYPAFRDWARASGYEPHLTIDRRDNDGNYEPGNCRWATAREQARNTRLTRRDASGRPLVEIAAEHGIDIHVLHGRLRAGWSIERATTEAVRPRRRVIRILAPINHSDARAAVQALGDLLAPLSPDLQHAAE